VGLVALGQLLKEWSVHFEQITIPVIQKNVLFGSVLLISWFTIRVHFSLFHSIFILFREGDATPGPSPGFIFIIPIISDQY